MDVEVEVRRLQARTAMLEYLADAAITVSHDREPDFIEEVHRHVQAELGAAKRGEHTQAEHDVIAAALAFIDKATTPEP